MKNTLLIATLLSFAAPSLALAHTYVKCGKTADLEEGTVSGYELELSSQGGDDYAGAVGGNWNLKLAEDGEWLAANPKITAKKTKVGDDTVIEITIKIAQAASGPVGTRYKLTGLYDDQPTLEKFTMGGFAGTQKIGTFQCISGND